MPQSERTGALPAPRPTLKDPMKLLATPCRLFFALCALSLLVAEGGLLVPEARAQALQPVSSDGVIEGVISIKFEEGAVPDLVIPNAQGVVVTGVASVDQLNQQFGVVEMTRIYRPAGRFEARHRKFGLDRWYTLRFRAGAAADIGAAVAAYGASPAVELAEFQYEKAYSDGHEAGRAGQVVEPPAASALAPRRSEVTNDPLYPAQWHYDNTGQTPPGGTPDADIDLPEAHDLEMGQPYVIVSVHDGGIDVDHEDLAANMWINEGEIPGNGVDDDNNGFVDDYHGYNFADDQGEIVADLHGTHVAGTVGAVSDNGIGVAGVAGGNGSADSGVRLMSVQIFSAGGGGFAEGFTYAADMGAVISQNSWGYTSPGVFEQAVLDGIDYYIANAGDYDGAAVEGGLVIFAAGNDNSDADYYPGFYEPTVAVASSGIDDQKSGFSNFGGWVDVTAPGGNGLPFDVNDVMSTFPNNQYGYLAGTSMACPHASGVAALIASASPGLTNEQVREALETSTDDIDSENPGFEGLLGTGRINAFQALAQLDPDDETPPGEITDLMAEAEGNTVTLTWTAPADDAGDPTSGPVLSYQVRYSTDGPIESAEDFADATPAGGAPSPGQPGEEEGFLVTDLDFNTQYWFAVRATDDNANTSLSNSASATTGEAPDLAFEPETLEAEMDLNDELAVPLTLFNEGPEGTLLTFTFPSFAADEAMARPDAVLNNTARPIASADHAKGQDALAGAGYPVTLGAGGPDEFGYEWIDSNEPGGPDFTWLDISEFGTELSLGDDQGTEVDLPFTFEFYGEGQGSVTIGSNGYLTFGTDGSEYVNTPIPDGAEPNYLIAPFWDDLSPNAGGTVHYYADEEAEQFIVQYTDVPRYQDPASSQTFQVVLGEGGGILFKYLDMNGTLNSATVGIENEDGSDGLQVAFNTAYVGDSLAVAIAAAPEFIADVNPASGTIEGGSSQEVEVIFSTADIDEPGFYEDDLVLLTNDPDESVVTIPAQVSAVTGPPEIVVTPTELDLGEVFLGGTEVGAFFIVNEGGGPLAVDSIYVDNELFAVDLERPTPYPFTVQIGDSVQVLVSYSPEELGVETATVTVESDDPDRPEVTVDVTAEGVPAPDIVTAPDSLSVTLEPGEMATDTLFVSNEGGSDLVFEAYFEVVMDTEPEQVAAAAPATRNVSVDPSLFAAAGQSAGGPGASDAEDATYQIDDGTSEDAIGLTNGGDVMWLNAFEAVDGSDMIAEISTTWGAAGSDGAPEEGSLATVFVYEDPNDDGDPTDAEMLISIETTVQNPGTNEFTTVSFTPTQVEGTFFVAVLYEDHAPGVFPAPLDNDSQYQAASWVVGSSGEFNADDLGANEIPPALTGDIGLTGNWLLRAGSGTTFITVSPSEGTVAPGETQELTVQFDATGLLEAGINEGNIVVVSNDPDEPVDNTPVTLEVVFGDPVIAVNPESVDFGEVFVGASRTETVTIFNEGTGPLEITEVSVDNDAFSVDVDADSSFTVGLGDSTQVAVTFMPDEVGPETGTLTIESNDPETGTITVALSGEGTPAPVIVSVPDSLFERVEIGGMATDTLTVTNEGGSDLTYFVNFDEDEENPDRAALAAPTAVTSGQRTEGAFASAVAPGNVPTTPLPLDAEDADYQLDDGSAENSIGLTNGGDIMWMNAFEATNGSATIGTIYSAYGSDGGSTLPPSRAATAYVYEDPDDDGNPDDAELVAEVDFTLEDPNTNEFTAVDMGGAAVDGVFFIAVLVEDHAPGQFPAPIDESSGSMQSSWVVGQGTGDFDDENLGNNGLPPSLVDDVGLPGNWLLRADAGDGTGGNFPDWIAVSPSEGTLAPGESEDLIVTYDASDLDLGTYTGDIEITSNDPATPVDVTPVTLEVGTAPYPFELEPDEINITLDLTQGDSTATEQFSIENITDEEQFFLIETRGASGEGPNMALPQEVQRLVDDLAAQLAAARPAASAEELTGVDTYAGQGGLLHKRLADMAGFPELMQEVGVTAYGFAGYFDGDLFEQFVQFDLGEPSELTGIGEGPTAYAGDFALGEEGFFYIITEDNEFQTVDVETGETTTVGMSVPEAGEVTWTELKTDPTDGTLYASTSQSLYTINPASGEATLVGSFGIDSGDVMIAIAVDDQGDIYGHEIIQDVIYRIDPETAEATLVGPTGVDASFAQGMDFDPVTGELYMAWYQGGGVGGLRTVDRETGNTELVGTFGGNEITFLAIPSEGFMFLDTDLLSGTLAPSGEVTLDLNFDASDLFAGTYEAELVVISDEPGMPEDFIPVTLTVIGAPEATLDPMALDFGDVFVGADTTRTITLTNTGTDDLVVSAIEVTPDVFSIPDSVETSFTLEPTEARSFAVTFSPDAVQDYTGTLTVVSDNPDGDVTATLTGEGIPAPVLAVSPDSFELFAVPGQTLEETLTISNEGGSPLTYAIDADFLGYEGPEQLVTFEFRDAILEEDFNDGIPSDWSVVDEYPGGVTWLLNTELDSDNYTGGSGAAAMASSDDNPSTPYDTKLITPEITASVEGYTLEFKANYQAYIFDDSLSVDITTDGGASWTTLASYHGDNEIGDFRGDGETVELNLASQIEAGDTFQVRWRYYHDVPSAFDWYAQIDDVVISRELEFLTIEPAAGTVEPGESEDVSINIDTEGLTGGTYEVALVVTSNDPANEEVTVPLTLTVVENLVVTPEPGPDSTIAVNTGEEFLVPISVNLFEGLGVESYEFTLTFDEDVLEPLGVETDGTLSEDVLVVANTEEPGQISVAAADQDGGANSGAVLFEIEGDGTLIFVRLRAIGADSTELAFSDFQFNEGEPDVSTRTTTVVVTPLYGDATLNGDVTAQDASEVLRYAVGLVDFSEAAFTAADVTGNGEVSALDAALILDFTTGSIDCFPVEGDCDDDEPLVATAGARTANATSASASASLASTTGSLAWGEPQKAADETGASNGAGASLTAAGGPALVVPLLLEQASGDVRAVEVTTQIDPSMVSVESVEANLPDGWLVMHNVTEDGALRIAMAGATPVRAGQLATVRLRWVSEDHAPHEASFSMGGETVINEGASATLLAAEVTVIPDEFTVSRSYPNPFSSHTTIAIDLPEKAVVTLQVFDMLGRRIIEQREEMKAGSGRSFQIDGRHLTAGTYVYRVIAEIGGEQQMKNGKLTLVR